MFNLPGPLHDLIYHLPYRMLVMQPQDLRQKFDRRYLDNGGWRGSQWKINYYTSVETGPECFRLVLDWYLLGMLVDPNFGLRSAVRQPAELAAIDRLAGFCLRAIRGDRPSAEEWRLLLEEGDRQRLEGLVARAALGEAKGLICQFSDAVADACRGQQIPRWGREPFADGTTAEMIFDGVANGIHLLFFRPFVKRRNWSHYLVQAHWLMRLMHLRWRAESEDEQREFDQLVAGNLQPMRSYTKRLRALWVPSAARDEFCETLQLMAELRSTAERVAA